MANNWTIRKRVTPRGEVGRLWGTSQFTETMPLFFNLNFQQVCIAPRSTQTSRSSKIVDYLALLHLRCSLHLEIRLDQRSVPAETPGTLSSPRRKTRCGAVTALSLPPCPAALFRVLMRMT